MKIARVVGNVVSTIRDESHYNKKTMIVEYVNEKLAPVGPRTIAFDAVDAGIGDIVLVTIDGGATLKFLGKGVLGDVTICGVIDEFNYDGNSCFPNRHGGQSS